MISLKNYRVHPDWSIDCITCESMSGEKTYSLYVIMECVSWKDVIHKYENIKSKEEANRLFKELTIKYKYIDADSPQYHYEGV